MTDCPHGAAVGHAAASWPAFAEQSCIQGTGDGEPLEAAPALSRVLLHRLGAKQTTDRKIYSSRNNLSRVFVIYLSVFTNVSNYWV